MLSNSPKHWGKSPINKLNTTKQQTHTPPADLNPAPPPYTWNPPQKPPYYINIKNTLQIKQHLNRSKARNTNYIEKAPSNTKTPRQNLNSKAGPN